MRIRAISISTSIFRFCRGERRLRSRPFSRRDGSEHGSGGDAESFFAHFASTPSQLWFAISEACNCEIVSRCYWPGELTLRCTSKINSSPTELVSLYHSRWFLLKQFRVHGTDNLNCRMTLRSSICNEIRLKLSFEWRATRNIIKWQKRFFRFYVINPSYYSVHRNIMNGKLKLYSILPNTL